jgi:Rhodopirellula transposase DDE domain
LAYPHAHQLLICADGGGSNGYRVRLWKYELWRLAKETGLAVTVCHLPPRTSKRNSIEHRLFSHISMSWPGRPLVSHEVVVELIAATTTKQGLKVHAERDLGTYPTEVSVSDADMRSITICHTLPRLGELLPEPTPGLPSTVSVNPLRAP